MTGLTLVGDVALGAACYALGAWSWPYLHKWALGADAYAAKLRAKAAAILAAARG
jgi:hypothetical protein